MDGSGKINFAWLAVLILAAATYIAEGQKCGSGSVRIKCKCGRSRTFINIVAPTCTFSYFGLQTCQACPDACDKFSYCEKCSKVKCTSCPDGKSGDFCNTTSYSAEIDEDYDPFPMYSRRKRDVAEYDAANSFEGLINLTEDLYTPTLHASSESLESEELLENFEKFTENSENRIPESEWLNPEGTVPMNSEVRKLENDNKNDVNKGGEEDRNDDESILSREDDKRNSGDNEFEKTLNEPSIINHSHSNKSETGDNYDTNVESDPVFDNFGYIDHSSSPFTENRAYTAEENENDPPQETIRNGNDFLTGGKIDADKYSMNGDSSSQGDDEKTQPNDSTETKAKRESDVHLKNTEKENISDLAIKVTPSSSEIEDKIRISKNELVQKTTIKPTRKSGKKRIRPKSSRRKSKVIKMVTHPSTASILELNATNGIDELSNSHASSDSSAETKIDSSDLQNISIVENDYVSTNLSVLDVTISTSEKSEIKTKSTEIFSDISTTYDFKMTDFSETLTEEFISTKKPKPSVMSTKKNGGILKNTTLQFEIQTKTTAPFKAEDVQTTENIKNETLQQLSKEYTTDFEINRNTEDSFFSKVKNYYFVFKSVFDNFENANEEDFQKLSVDCTQTILPTLNEYMLQYIYSEKSPAASHSENEAGIIKHILDSTNNSSLTETEIQYKMLLQYCSELKHGGREHRFQKSNSTVKTEETTEMFTTSSEANFTTSTISETESIETASTPSTASNPTELTDAKDSLSVIKIDDEADLYSATITSELLRTNESDIEQNSKSTLITKSFVHETSQSSSVSGTSLFDSQWADQEASATSHLREMQQQEIKGQDVEEINQNEIHDRSFYQEIRQKVDDSAMDSLLLTNEMKDSAMKSAENNIPYPNIFLEAVDDLNNGNIFQQTQLVSNTNKQAENDLQISESNQKEFNKGHDMERSGESHGLYFNEKNHGNMDQIPLLGSYMDEKSMVSPKSQIKNEFETKFTTQTPSTIQAQNPIDSMSEGVLKWKRDLAKKSRNKQSSESVKNSKYMSSGKRKSDLSTEQLYEGYKGSKYVGLTDFDSIEREPEEHVIKPSFLKNKLFNKKQPFQFKTEKEKSTDKFDNEFHGFLQNDSPTKKSKGRSFPTHFDKLGDEKTETVFRLPENSDAHNIEDISLLDIISDRYVLDEVLEIFRPSNKIVFCVEYKLKSNSYVEDNKHLLEKFNQMFSYGAKVGAQHTETNGYFSNMKQPHVDVTFSDDIFRNLNDRNSDLTKMELFQMLHKLNELNNEKSYSKPHMVKRDTRIKLLNKESSDYISEIFMARECKSSPIEMAVKCSVLSLDKLIINLSKRKPINHDKLLKIITRVRIYDAENPKVNELRDWIPFRSLIRKKLLDGFRYQNKQQNWWNRRNSPIHPLDAFFYHKDNLFNLRSRRNTAGIMFPKSLLHISQRFPEESLNLRLCTQYPTLPGCRNPSLLSPYDVPDSINYRLGNSYAPPVSEFLQWCTKYTTLPSCEDFVQRLSTHESELCTIFPSLPSCERFKFQAESQMNQQLKQSSVITFSNDGKLLMFFREDNTAPLRLSGIYENPKIINYLVKGFNPFEDKKEIFYGFGKPVYSEKIPRNIHYPYIYHHGNGLSHTYDIKKDSLKPLDMYDDFVCEDDTVFDAFVNSVVQKIISTIRNKLEKSEATHAPSEFDTVSIETDFLHKIPFSEEDMSSRSEEFSDEWPDKGTYKGVKLISEFNDENSEEKVVDSDEELKKEREVDDISKSSESTSSEEYSSINKVSSLMEEDELLAEEQAEDDAEFTVSELTSEEECDYECYFNDAYPYEGFPLDKNTEPFSETGKRSEENQDSLTENREDSDEGNDNSKENITPYGEKDLNFSKGKISKEMENSSTKSGTKVAKNKASSLEDSKPSESDEDYLLENEKQSKLQEEYISEGIKSKKSKGKLLKTQNKLRETEADSSENEKAFTVSGHNFTLNEDIISSSNDVAKTEHYLPEKSSNLLKKNYHNTVQKLAEKESHFETEDSFDCVFGLGTCTSSEESNKTESIDNSKRTNKKAGLENDITTEGVDNKDEIELINEDKPKADIKVFGEELLRLLATSVLSTGSTDQEISATVYGFENETQNADLNPENTSNKDNFDSLTEDMNSSLNEKTMHDEIFLSVLDSFNGDQIQDDHLVDDNTNITNYDKIGHSSGMNSMIEKIDLAHTELNHTETEKDLMAKLSVDETEVNTFPELGETVELAMNDIDGDSGELYRNKRFMFGIPYNNWCVVPSLKRHGNLICLVWEGRKECTLTCHQGFYVDGQESQTFTCLGDNGVWNESMKCIPASGDGLAEDDQNRLGHDDLNMASPHELFEERVADSNFTDNGLESTQDAAIKQDFRRKKRDPEEEIPQNNWCVLASDKRYGDVTCTVLSYKKTCSLTCHEGFQIDGKGSLELTCDRKSGMWSRSMKCSPVGGEETPPKSQKNAEGMEDNNSKYLMKQDNFAEPVESSFSAGSDREEANAGNVEGENKYEADEPSDINNNFEGSDPDQLKSVGYRSADEFSSNPRSQKNYDRNAIHEEKSSNTNSAHNDPSQLEDSIVPENFETSNEEKVQEGIFNGSDQVSEVNSDILKKNTNLAAEEHTGENIDRKNNEFLADLTSSKVEDLANKDEVTANWEFGESP